MGIFVDAIKEHRASELDLVRNPGAFFASIFGEAGHNAAGIPVTVETALRYSPVVACARILAESIAQVPFNVMRARPGGGADLAIDSQEHKLLHRSPNERMSSYTFRVGLMLNAVMRGGGYAELKWNGAGKLGAVRLLPADKVEILTSTVSDAVYYRVTRDDGKKDELHMSDVIHIPTLALDGITGHSLMRAHEEGIAAGLAAEKHTSSFLGKGSRPAGALVSDQPLKADQRKELGETWQEAYGGAGNAGKTPVLAGGLKWQPLTMNAVDAQLVQTREFQVAECARVFRIPGVFLGLKEASTYASAEQFFLSFVKFTLAPWAEAIEQEFDRKLFPNDLSRYTHLDLRGLMRGDAVSRVAYYKGMFDMGAMTSDEARAEEDLNPIAGGARAYVQQNLMPVDMVDEVLKAKAQPKPVTAPKPDAQMNSIHGAWLESVIARMRGWQRYEPTKGAAALAPVFRSLAAGRSVDVDAFCRTIAEEAPGEGFATRALEKFAEVCQ